MDCTIATTPHTEKSEYDKQQEDECIVCWEPNNKSSELITLTCRHQACRACVESWIERCETNGQDQATCPHCRQGIDVPTVLGRSYQRKPSTVQQTVDDFTRSWFQENNAIPCQNCGILQIQEDGDDMPVACVCGFIYCWNCETNAQECDCDHYEFFDPLSGEALRMEDANRYPVAGPEHFEDLGDFMEERRGAINRQLDGDEDDEEGNEQEEDTLVVEEPAESDLVALFVDCGLEEAEATPNDVGEEPVGANLVAGAGVVEQKA